MEKNFENNVNIKDDNMLNYNNIHISNCDCIACLISHDVWVMIGKSLCEDYQFTLEKESKLIDSEDEFEETNLDYKIEEILFGQLTVINFIRKIELFLNTHNYKFTSIHHNNQIIEYKIIFNELKNNNNNSINILVEILNENNMTGSINTKINYKKITVDKITIKYFFEHIDYFNNLISNIKNFFNKNN